MYKQREKIIVLFSLLLLLGGVIPGQAQKDNRFEVSKNLDIFNALVKEVEMFYVDSVDVEKTVRKTISCNAIWRVLCGTAESENQSCFTL